MRWMLILIFLIPWTEARAGIDLNQGPDRAPGPVVVPLGDLDSVGVYRNDDPIVTFVGPWAKGQVTGQTWSGPIKVKWGTDFSDTVAACFKLGDDDLYLAVADPLVNMLPGPDPKNTEHKVLYHYRVVAYYKWGKKETYAGDLEVVAGPSGLERRFLRDNQVKSSK